MTGLPSSPPRELVSVRHPYFKVEGTGTSPEDAPLGRGTVPVVWGQIPVEDPLYVIPATEV